MSLWKIMYSRWRDLPPITMFLTLSCLVISIPLLISPELYMILGFNDGAVNHYWQAITSSFAHGAPENSMPAPLPHLIGNVLAITLLGGLIERVLGSGRFFILTLATFTTHTIWKVLYGGGNGASGFCWGYVVVAALVLFWEWQKRKKQVFRDPLYIGMIALSAFMVIGVAIVLWIRGFGLWNGSNQAHSLSILTALPFVFLWRSVMRGNWQQLKNSLSIDSGRSLLNTGAIGASILLLVFNLTFAAVGVSALRSESLSTPQMLSMTPQSSDLETLNRYNQQVTILFNRPMESYVHMERVSISWLDEKGVLDYSFHWEDTQTLVFVLSREVYEGESVLLIANARDERWGLVIPVEIKYR